MARTTVHIEDITIDELVSIIERKFDEYLSNNNDEGVKNEYLTRQETAEILKISLPTLHSYVKEGIVSAYRIGGRVRFKKSDIDEALKKIEININPNL